MRVRNPRNGRFDYELHEDDVQALSLKAKSLRLNQKNWNQLHIDERSKILLTFADLMDKHKDEIIHQLSIDTGRKRISEIEFDGTIGMIRGRCYSAPGLLTEGKERPSVTNPTVMIRQQWIPFQLVGVISPWNFPLLLALIDTIPALLAGCSVLLKPSEVTPRHLDVLDKVVEKVPKLSKVLHIARGGPDVGKAVVDYSDAVCFTGSVPTGMKIGQRAAERFIPAFLELGGKDPAIVLEDADLEIATDAILRSAAGASGQACQALERVYVQRTMYKPFLDLLVQKCKETSLNIDDNKGGNIGPLIFAGQAEKIEEQIKKAVAQGAKILHGGEIETHNGGLWMKPTVLIDVNHSMDIMTEETFGPVIPIMAFDKLEAAIDLANDSKYGLSASVFSQDRDKAVEVAMQINAGGISINDGSLTNQVFDASKNSFKLSGINGSRMGVDGFLRFFRKKALLIQNAHPATIHSQAESE